MLKGLVKFLILAIFALPATGFALEYDCYENECVSEFVEPNDTKYFSGVIFSGNLESQNNYVQFKFADGGTSEWVLLSHDIDHSEADIHDQTTEKNSNDVNLQSEDEHSGVVNSQSTKQNSEAAGPQSTKDSGHNENEEIDKTLVNTKTAKSFRIKKSSEVTNLSYQIIGKRDDVPRDLLAGQSFSGLNIISRDSWGGYEKENKSLKLVASQSFLPDFSKYSAKQDPEISKVLGFVDNKTLLWPREYANDIKMLVIHHTASTNEIDDPMQAMKNIHEFHTNVKNWGDIGYHYLISPDGRVFEGRAGGAGVIGGHSYAVNKVSVGISVMGNYQNELVPDPVMHSLAKLLEKLSEQYDLDPMGNVYYKSKTIPVIGGHRDSGQTLCPGENLYNRIPELRSWVASNMSLNPKPFKLISKNLFEVTALQKTKIDIELTNLTTQNWNTQNTYLTALDVSTKNIIGDKKFFLTRPARSGQKAQFELDFEIGNVSGFKPLKLGLVHNNTRFSQELFINLVVDPVDLEYSFNAKAARIQTREGGQKNFTIGIENKSDIDFDAKNPVYLAILNTDSALDALKVSSNKLNIDSLETKEFKIEIAGVNKPGVYTYQLGLISPELGVIDGETFEVVIDNRAIQTSSRNIPMDYLYQYKMPINEWQLMKIRVPNNTDRVWEKDKFKITHVKDFNTYITIPKLVQDRVLPGEVAIVEFKTRVDNDNSHLILMRFFETRFIYSKFTRIEINRNGVSSTDKKSAQSNTNVATQSQLVKSTSIETSRNASSASIANVAKNESKTKEPTVRVHITGGSLDRYEISCNSDFISNLGGLRKYKANEKLVVNIKSANQDIARFEPIDGGICIIHNLERRPAWNQSLNDNEFRGNLEIRFDDNEPILINELKMEDYLKGLGEVSNSSDLEKAKTIMVAARSYAVSYTGDVRKFKSKPYDLNDDPNATQKYIGYGMEKRSPLIVKAVNQTRGKVVSYKQETIKVPYFNQSAGFTKSAKAVWGWDDTPYLEGVKDPYCKANSFLGHGVGISGCGASQMALEGFDFEEIIKYYLPGTEIKTLY